MHLNVANSNQRKMNEVFYESVPYLRTRIFALESNASDTLCRVKMWEEKNKEEGGKAHKNATFSDAFFHSWTSGHIVNLSLASSFSSRTGTIFRRRRREAAPSFLLERPSRHAFTIIGVSALDESLTRRSSCSERLLMLCPTLLHSRFYFYRLRIGQGGLCQRRRQY